MSDTADEKPKRGSKTGNPSSLVKAKPTSRNQHSPDKGGVSDLERAFVQNYVICWNATKAAIAAGYSEKTAYSTGHKLTKTPRVKALIDAHLAAVKQDYRQTHEAITDFLMRVIYADTTDLLELKSNAAGKSVVEFKESAKLAPGTGMLINSITVGRNGIKIDIFSKQQAVEMLGRHIGYFEADNKQKNVIGPVLYIPDNGRDEPAGS